MVVFLAPAGHYSHESWVHICAAAVPSCSAEKSLLTSSWKEWGKDCDLGTVVFEDASPIRVMLVFRGVHEWLIFMVLGPVPGLNFCGDPQSAVTQITQRFWALMDELEYDQHGSQSGTLVLSVYWIYPQIVLGIGHPPKVRAGSHFWQLVIVTRVMLLMEEMQLTGCDRSNFREKKEDSSYQLVPPPDFWII